MCKIHPKMGIAVKAVVFPVLMPSELVVSSNQVKLLIVLELFIMNKKEKT